MFSETAGLRERAYVLWEMERMERHMMLKVLEGVPETPNQAYSDGKFDDMQQSFEQRSKIWQKGGLGYLRKNNTSKIAWPTKST